MNKNTPRCSQCNSELILVKQVTQQLEGTRFPQTSKTYKCSNEACQERLDKETAKRIQLKQDKEAAMQKRTEQKLQEKQDLANLLEQKTQA